MIAVDTNILVRLLTQDDEQQYIHSLKLFQENDIFVPNSVILETEWMLRFAYHFQPKEICTGFRNLLGLQNVSVTNPTLIAQVLKWHEDGLDFTDAFHLAQSHNCSSFHTFDDKFVKRAKGLSKVKVQKP